MKLEYLEEFLLLSKTENYADAAQGLFISESALSRHIMALEKELGVELFVRSSRGIALSDAGSAFIPYAKRVISALDEYSNHVSSKGFKHKLTIGFVHSITSYGVMNHLINFRNSNPDISMLFTEGDSETLCQKLKNDECDFAFFYEYKFLNASDLEKYCIKVEKMCIAVPADSEYANCASLSLQQVKNEQFIMQSQNGALFKYSMQLMKKAGVKPLISTYTESRHYLLELVSQGLGISLLEKERFAGECPENVKLIPLDPPAHRTLYLFRRAGELSPAKKRLLNFIKENIQAAEP